MNGSEGSADAGAWFRSLCYGLAVLLVVADQWSKQAVSASLTYGEQVLITPWFNLTLLHNRGAAFSFLNAAGGWQRWFFAGLAIVVSVLIAYWLRGADVRRARFYVGLAAVLGGAVGNLIDRIRFGHVVDFIQVHYLDWYYPAFNVADSAITVGAALLIWDGLFPRPTATSEPH